MLTAHNFRQIKCYWIVIQRDASGKEDHFDFHCYEDKEARDYAQRVARLCGPHATVKVVKRV